VALNLSQSATARGRVPVLPYVIPSALSAQSSASTVSAKRGIVCVCYILNCFINLVCCPLKKHDHISRVDT